MLEEFLKDKKNKRSLIWIILFLVIAISLLFTKKPVKKNVIPKQVNYNEKVEELFNKISDNYTLEVTLFNKNKEFELEYMTDGNYILYSSSTFPHFGYLVYKNDIYYLDNNKLHKTDKLDINRIFNERLYDINFIKLLINNCNLNKVSDIRKKCDIDVSKYIKLYNEYYQDNISSNSDDDIDIEIIHNDTRIRSIIIEYDDIFENVDDLKYNIDISNINKNDFSTYDNIINEKSN